MRELCPSTQHPHMFKAEWIQRAYQRFLELPVPAVLAVMCLVGAAIVGLCVLAFYLYGSAVVRILLGP
jgi:hypothetical protein